MKINIFTFIIYILAIAALSAFALIYEQPAIVLFILMLLVLLPLSISIFLYANSKYDFTLSYKTPFVEEPNSPVFLLEYKNSSRFPLFSCDVYFTADNRYYPNDITHKLSIPLTQKNNSFSVPIESFDIGLVSMHVTKIVFQDYLSLFRKEVDITLDASVPVLPKERNIGDFPPAVPKDGPDEFTESENIGNISSDVKEIREYRPGDRLQRIHWKLSAKLDDLFVKEMAHTSSLAIILIPELNKNKIHDTAQSLLSCIKVMYEKKERFELCIYNNNAMDYSFFTVTNEEEMIEAMVNFYCQPLYDGEDNALNTYLNSSGKIATVIHIVGKKILIGE